MKRSQLPIYLLLTGLLAVFSSSSVLAKDYLVEVVLFETIAGRDASTGGLYYPKTQGGFRLGSEKAAAARFRAMERGLTLVDNAAAIAASGRYRLLRHLAWRQPGLDADNAHALRISLGETTNLYLPDDPGEYDEFIPASAQPSEGRSSEIRSSTLNGSIKVRLGRFLHMDCLLVYTDTETAQSFRMAQSRKMRSGELHYIDNPRFGLLTRITPLDDEAPDAEQDEESPAATTAE